MKVRKKSKTLMALVAVCLIAILAFGSLAYFTDSDSVTNDFMVAGYDPSNPDAPIDPDELFSITVYETDLSDPTGQTTTSTGQTYEDILPGSVLAKDPTVENTGQYSQWVRVSVTVSNAANWKTVLGTTPVSSIMNIDTANWTSAGDAVENTADDTITYTYYLNSALAAGDTATLFTEVTIPSSLNVNQMVSLKEFTITIAADAIQSENTGDSAAYAFTNYWN